MDTPPLNSAPLESQIRVHGDSALPTLVFLPGLHGNWRLIGGFRRALEGRLRFVETSYPPTLTWSLVDYAESVETALAENGISRGWLLGESFSSQVVWQIIARERFQVEGLILAGGFVRHPYGRGVYLVERISGQISFGLLVRILFGYARLARFRFRGSPETIEGIDDFIAHLTEADRQAAKHRLHLVGQNDPCPIARQTTIPVYGVTGFFDPIVPWYGVRRWLMRNCPGLRDYRVILRADHNVLGTAPKIAADQVVKWMQTARGIQGDG